MGKNTPFVRQPRPHFLACPVHVTAHPLAREFFEIAAREGVALFDVAARSGYHYSTYTGWKRRSAPTVEAFQASLNALGYELVIQKRRGA